MVTRRFQMKNHTVLKSMRQLDKHGNKFYTWWEEHPKETEQESGDIREIMNSKIQ